MDEKYAKDIKECEDCPLYGSCHGVSATPNGYSEPPCASWTDDMLIYEGMYDE